MCDCLQKIRENLKANDPTIGAIDVECDNVFDIDPSTLRKTGAAKTGQPIKVYHERKTKKGDTRYNSRQSFLAHIHCPFCGVEYNKTS